MLPEGHLGIFITSPRFVSDIFFPSKPIPNVGSCRKFKYTFCLLKVNHSALWSENLDDVVIRRDGEASLWKKKLSTKLNYFFLLRWRKGRNPAANHVVSASPALQITTPCISTTFINWLKRAFDRKIRNSFALTCNTKACRPPNSKQHDETI